MTTPSPIVGAAAAGATNRSNPAGDSLGTTDMFLKLLVAELRSQNPLDPQKGTEFVAQLAQFNTLEQLIAIRAELHAMRQASSASSPAAQSGATSAEPSAPNPAANN